MRGHIGTARRRLGRLDAGLAEAGQVPHDVLHLPRPADDGEVVERGGGLLGHRDKAGLADDPRAVGGRVGTRQRVGPEVAATAEAGSAVKCSAVITFPSIRP
jgi:hypothetical protein